MPDYYLETQGELVGDIKPPAKKKRNILLVFLKIFLILIFVVSLSVSALLIYVRVKYPNPCFVNGMSMYPTFNADGLKYEDGSYRPLRYTDGTQGKDDSVDYGFTDESSGAIEGVKRFDIVVTYYKADFREPYNFDLDFSENHYDDSSHAPKIKRLIGLPGETITLQTDGTPMGKLYVWSKTAEKTEPNETDAVIQPLTQEDYDRPLQSIEGYETATYPAMTDAYYDGSGSHIAAHTWTLGKKGSILGDTGIDADEYLVMGDNRAGGNSYDCRWAAVGPVYRYYIQSKVVMMIGRCKISGDSSCNLEYSTIKWPWNIQRL